jgi:hypothetical protein
LVLLLLSLAVIFFTPRFVLAIVCGDSQPVRSAYQPPASSTFLSERTSHRQLAATSQQFSSLRTNHHQPSATSQPKMLSAAGSIHRSSAVRK